MVTCSVPSYAQNKSDPVDLQADKLEHDQSGQTVTASGNVILIQAGRTVKADKIIYNLTQDTVIATGDVEFIDVNGDKHYAQKTEFNNALKDGFVEGLQTFLADGSRFTSSNGKHIGGNKTIMKDATYTACEACEEKPDELPIWQIRASEVEHDKVAKTVKYRNARFEIKGVPIGYMPYFEHADGTVKRKSGFLAPSAGFTTDQGAFVQSDYYWSIAPDKDLTAGLRAYTSETPLGFLEWRQRWNDASLKVDTSFTSSERTDNNSGQNVKEDGELRGNLKAKGLWNMNHKWRSGINLNLASDDQYLRQYDIDSEDVLENEIYTERFSGRNYASGRILAFQDVRVDDNATEDQPLILPEITTSFLGEQGSVPLIGGRWSVDASMLGIQRDKNAGQDVNRGFLGLGWQRRFISDFGLVSKVDTQLQGTFYNVNDRDGSENNAEIEGNSSEGRAFGYMNVQTSYPVAKRFEKSQMVVEPLVAVTLAPDLSDDSDIPNEDSQDVQLDALNIFEADRFPGVDGVEDQSHMTYGLRTGLYTDDGSYGEAFVAQSYRFEEEENPFGQGSGLDEQSSDIVAKLSGGYKDKFKLNYGLQLDNDTLSSVSHEVDTSLKVANLTLSSRYLFGSALEGTDISESREQIVNSGTYKFDDNWSVYGSARHDLGEDPGLRTAGAGINYTGQCISLSLSGQRNLTNESSGDNGTEIFLRIGFKNLGEFATSGLQVGGNKE